MKNSNELQVVKIPNQPLYRYMSIKGLDRILSTQSIGLHRINKFEDTNEYYIKKYNDEINKIFYMDRQNDQMQNHIFALCFSATDPQSEDFFWKHKNYAADSDSVCIETSVLSFLNCIDTNKCYSCLSSVEYASLENSILQYKLTNAPFEHPSFSPCNPIDLTFQFAFLKSLEYKEEKEIRFAIISPYTDGEWLISPLKDFSFISKIWIHPEATSESIQAVEAIAIKHHLSYQVTTLI